MHESSISSGALVIFFVFFVYLVLGAFIEKMRCVVGHETGLTVIVGMCISFVAWYIQKGEFVEMMEFDESFFFYFCLPPIIFSSGYNMKRKKFFENILNISLFGLFNTVMQFMLFSFLTWCVVQTGILYKYDPQTDTYV